MNPQSTRTHFLTRLLPHRLWLALLATLALLLILTGVAFAVTPYIDLAQNQQDVVVRGDWANGYMSEVTGSADFNDDGYDDLLMGAAGYGQNGSFSGAAFMVLGGPNLDSEINFVTAQPDFVAYGASQNDILGHSVAAGDVNGDGVGDMIISADGFDNGENRGAVYVILGGNGAFATPVTLDLSTGAKPDVTILGATSGNRFGRSVASGDVNGDSIDDIIVGAYKAWPGGRVEAGAVYAILGRSSFTKGSPVTISLSQQQAALTIYGEQGSSTTQVAALAARQDTLAQLLTDELSIQNTTADTLGDRLGRSVAVGDINGDGIDDVIAGAYGANWGAQNDVGKTYVVYGSSSYADASPTIVDLGANPKAADLRLIGVDAGDQSGFYVAAGDINHNGFDDVLTSAYFSRGYGNSGSETGEVYVVFGGNSLPKDVALSSAPLTIYGAAAGDRLGRSLAAADVNGDSYADLLLGASRADPDGRLDAGIAYVIFGRDSFSTPIVLSNTGSADLKVLGADASGVVCADDPQDPRGDCGDEAGHSISAGDINGDSINDIMVGALFSNNGSLEDAGATFIIYGRNAFHGDPVSITIQPDGALLQPGKSLTFHVIAEDAQGFTWDATTQATYSIDAAAGGSWNASTYTAENIGAWTVTAEYAGLNDTASLNVLANLRYLYLPVLAR